MDSWWHRNFWKIVGFPTLAAVLVGGVAFVYAYLHNRAGFDKDGKAINPPVPGPVAPAPPTRTPIGEVGLLTLVVDDLTRAGKETAPHLRYLSLVHRHDDPTAAAAQLDRDRQGVIDLVAALSPPGANATVAALDPARTVFRLDLRALEWNAESWRNVTRGYPYGLKFTGVADTALAEVAGKLRERTEERLPVVHADWWVSALIRPPLSAPGGLGLTTKTPPAAVKAAADAHRDHAVDLATAARELRATEGEVTGLIEGAENLRTEFGLGPLLRAGGSVPRDAWESDRHTVSPFQELAERLKRGQPVIRR